MCRFFSCLVTKNDVLYDLNIDSHEDLIKKFNLHDNTTNPTFVRIECIPKDGNIFNHESTNWETRKDQDCIPDWFDIREVDKLVKKELKTVFKKLFVSKGSVKIDNGRLFVNGSASVIASGSASVKAYESASVEAWGSASVKAYESASVEAWGSASVIACWSASVKAYESASVKAYESASVEAWGSASVKAWGSASVKAYDSASVEAWGSASVEAYGESNIIAFNKLVTLHENAKMIDRTV